MAEAREIAATTTQTGVAAARAQRKSAEDVRKLNYIETAALCGVKLDADGKHPQCPAWSYEVERRKIARVLENDVEIAAYDTKATDLATMTKIAAASLKSVDLRAERILGPRPEAVSL